MSRTLPTDLLSLNYLHHIFPDDGVSEPIPAQPIPGSTGFQIDEDAWEAWNQRHGLCHRFSSFAQLFRAQTLDGDSTSLSFNDLRGEIIFGASEEEAQRVFVEFHSFPEALIGEDQAFVLRSREGRYFRMASEETGSWIREIPGEEGRFLEIESATRFLEERNDRFQNASFAEQLLMKNSTYRSDLQPPRGPSCSGNKCASTLPEASEMNRCFAGLDYRRLNPNSFIAYRPGSEISRFFLTQPQNACVAAALLNSAIFSGLPVDNDTHLLANLQDRLAMMQGSFDGRMDFNRLMEDVERGRIPGLRIRRIEPCEAVDRVRDRQPVLALVPYFNGHAWMVREIDIESDSYRAIDTVTGMVVERNGIGFHPPEIEGEGCRADPQVFLQLINSEFIQGLNNDFFAVDFTNIRGFLDWLLQR